MRQVDRLIATAESHIGRGEEGANNAGPYVYELHRKKRRRGEWCSAFVATCIEETGIMPPIPDRNRRGAKGLTKYLAKISTGRWIAEPRFGRVAIPVSYPKMGDVVCWHRGVWKGWTGHVELVTAYDPDTDTLHTIAGNVGKFPAYVKRRIHANGSWRKSLFGLVRLGLLHGERPD